MSATARPVRSASPHADRSARLPHTADGAAPDPWRQLQVGLALALEDPTLGRADLRAALAGFTDHADAPGRLIAAAALVQFIGIADDDYGGFEPAVAAVIASAAQVEAIHTLDHRLLARAGALIAGWFRSLDDPALAAQAEAITRELGNELIAPAARCCAGLAALAYFDARMSLEGVLWVELAMRPVLAAAGTTRRFADEWQHALVQSLYQCAAPARAESARARHVESAGLSAPAIELKWLLLAAQMAIGEGRIEAGHQALARAEPLLHPRAPRPAGWWHLLQSRLALTGGQHRDALTHARLALRLTTEAQLPERWNGVTVMQEGQVQMAAGAFALATPFFERAGRAATGAQADFCWCLAHFARALARFDTGSDDASACVELRLGLAMACRMQWHGFFRPSPRVAAQICARALEHDIEPAFVRQVIAERRLDAVRADLSAWPWPIRVRTLGRFQIEHDGVALAFAGKVARKPLELLQFAIASGGSDVSATTVMFALWRDLEGDKAKSAFNVALHRLRKLLGNDDAIQLELGRLSLNPKVVWVDCLAFEQLVDRSAGTPSTSSTALTPQTAADLQRAVALYRGHFLHETEDEPWQMVCRTRLASKFKRSVLQLGRHTSSPADALALRAIFERALELDPMAEDLARALMQWLAERGEQAAALNVFEHCQAAIARGLGARPAATTLVLVERIRAMG